MHQTVTYTAHTLVQSSSFKERLISDPTGIGHLPFHKLLKSFRIAGDVLLCH